MKYFPLTKDRFEHQFGIQALADGESIVEATAEYEREISMRRDALALSRNEYFQWFAESLPAQQQARDLIIAAAPFLDGDTNKRTGESIDLQHELPLLEIARHVQEDLAIISGDASRGFPLIAGAVLFPSGWSVGDKIGKSISSIHEPVPDFQREMNTPTEQLLGRLKPGRPVWRTNWGVRPSGRLDQSTKYASLLEHCRRTVTSSNAGVECYFRVERQTLSRLDDGDVLFTIHTHQAPICQLSQEQQKNLLGVLETCPSGTLQYKGIWRMHEPIMAYLRESLG